MPTDLDALAKDQAVKDMSPLDRTENPADSTKDKLPTQVSSNEPDQANMFAAQGQQNAKRDNVHPYTQTLTLSDVESCVILEEAAFPPQERATREKVSLSFSFPFLPGLRHSSRADSCQNVLPVTCPCHSTLLHALAFCS